MAFSIKTASRWLGGGAVALVAGLGLSTGASASCILETLADVPIEIQGPRAIVDTGSSTTLLLPAAAARLGLTPQPLRGIDFYGVGGAADARFVRVHFQLPGADMPQFGMIVAGHRASDADGLLGASYLLQSDIDFDFPDKRLRLIRPKGCNGDQVVYWGKAYSVAPLRADPSRKIILVDVKLNGHTMRAELDTGASISIVTSDAARAAGVAPHGPDSAPAGALRGVGARKVAGFHAVFDTFSLGGETIRNAHLTVADVFAADTVTPTASHIPEQVIETPDMILGADFFRSHHVYAALSQRKVYVS
ncbi:MAG TPA: aspartyl protease family protein, partial [Caulobacteraceae bacterium]|nr:aspartyl protease family protein [Caulobacteraceae bacterium]